MNWRHWLHRHRQQQTPTTSATQVSGCHAMAIGQGAADRGSVRLYADCGRAEFDSANRLIAVACPAVLCGSVPAAGNRIGEHLTWDTQPCRWSGWRIVDDRVRPVRAAS
ncbi:hypothetical protein [Nocardia pneumoniae]|uniref:hypothetical protein n=1 Tax=Nocardia pneumoniae TaxID=228601 RepID=UPI0012F67DE9|nr:hypothetical protein [Nocardia pneumoniae]